MQPETKIQWRNQLRNLLESENHREMKDQEVMNKRSFWKEINGVLTLYESELENAPDEVVGQILTALDKVLAGYLEARQAIENWNEIEKEL